MCKMMKRILVYKRHETHHDGDGAIPSYHVWFPCKQLYHQIITNNSFHST